MYLHVININFKKETKINQKQEKNMVDKYNEKKDIFS